MADEPHSAPAKPSDGRVLHGTGLSPGYGEGRAVLFGAGPRAPLPRFTVRGGDVEGEVHRLRQAVEEARRDLERVRLRVRADVGPSEAEIFAVHEGLLASGELLDRITERVRRDGQNAEQAVDAEVREAAARLSGVEDPFFRDRALDVRDVGRRLLDHLAPRQSDAVAPLPPRSVLVAVELLPSETVDLDRAHVAAIVTELGGETSHAAILARALGIPAVTAVEGATRCVPEGATVLVDGERGEVVVLPTASQTRTFHQRQEAWDRAQSEAEATGKAGCRTADGEPVVLRANLGRLDEAHAVRRHHLDGVGLFRTEFLFLDSREPPGFERQLGVYRQVTRALEGLPLNVRTLDLGGDKVPPFLAAHAERNPSLGLRGLRFSLGEDRLFRTQLRALALAAESADVGVLFPMVLGGADVREAVARLREESEGAALRVGAMIETPAAVFAIDEILEAVDFVSLGTNDLTQFMLAADRDAVDLLEGYSVLHPSVLRAIGHVVEAARRRGRPLSVCGEAAGDPLSALVLVGLGVRELSMSPARAARVRQALGRVDREDAEAAAREALEAPGSEAVKRRLEPWRREVLAPPEPR